MNPLTMPWQCWVSSFACFIIITSCVLAINDMPRNDKTFEKLVHGSVAVGAFGIMLTPFFEATVPSAFEVMFRFGSAILSVWLTHTLWDQLLDEVAPFAAALDDDDEQPIRMK